MKMHGNLDLLSHELRKAVLPEEASFPVDAKAGQFCFINKIVYVCVEITSGVPDWVPLTKVIDTYMHIQDVASTTWTITHGMGYRPSVQIVVEVDGQNVVMLPKSITHASDNQVVVEFSLARTGTARLV